MYTRRCSCDAIISSAGKTRSGNVGREFNAGDMLHIGAELITLNEFPCLANSSPIDLWSMVLNSMSDQVKGIAT
jgi:hypothetical protein